MVSRILEKYCSSSYEENHKAIEALMQLFKELEEEIAQLKKDAK